MDFFDNIYDYIVYLLVDYIDVDYSLWLFRLLMPFIITFLLPGLIVLQLYITSLVLYIYKFYRHNLRQAYEGHNWFDAARKTVAAIWDAHGWVYHGYEVTGIENIPDEEPVLFVYYHGAIPIDLYYFISRIYLLKNKLIHSVADRFLFKIPGWSIISENLKVIPGTIQTCSNILKEGNMLAISPGGVYEAQFGSNLYELLWKKRVGFAKVAIDAKVNIIPMFTENIREAFRSVGLFRRMFLKIYSLTKIPLAPIYGGFPVKLTTHLGKPIIIEEDITPEELQTRVANAINELIGKHQRVPGSIVYALKDRFIRKEYLL